MTANEFPSNAEREAARATQYSVFGTLNLSHIRSGVESILRLYPKTAKLSRMWAQAS